MRLRSLQFLCRNPMIWAGSLSLIPSCWGWVTLRSWRLSEAFDLWLSWFQHKSSKVIELSPLRMSERKPKSVFLNANRLLAYHGLEILSPDSYCRPLGSCLITRNLFLRFSAARSDSPRLKIILIRLQIHILRTWWRSRSYAEYAKSN